jgi:hypothetical protein
MSEAQTLSKMKLVTLIEKSSLSDKAKDEIYKNVLKIKPPGELKKGGKVKGKKMMYGSKVKKRK